MKKILITLAFVFPLMVIGQTQTENYIKSIQYQIKTPVETVVNTDKIESIIYFDGIGRPKQSIGVRAGGQSQDIITPIDYDEYGRQVLEYLPYASSTSIGTFRSNAIDQSANYVGSPHYDFYHNTKYEFTANPYSESDLENSPLNRVLKQASPGYDWRLGSGHEIEFDYKTNIAGDEVRLFSVNLTTAYLPTLVSSGSSYYLAGELYKTITRDENHVGSTKNHTTEEFKDKEGRVVLKRTFADVDLNNDGDKTDANESQNAHDTYYVYDRFGNLTYVIPPKVNTADGVSATELNELCYQYRYDSRNRLIEKKIPGKGSSGDWEEIVYNKQDQPILTRDPKLKSEQKWIFTLYDAYGRVAYTGIDSGNSTPRVTMQSNADAIAKQYVTKTSTPTTYVGTPVYYTKDAYPNSFDEVLTINYYDNYTFDLAGLTVPTGKIYEQDIATNVKGLPTGSKVRVLGTSHWITTIMVYDEKGRAIYVASKNEYLNITDIVQTEYDFLGNVVKTKARHQKGTDNEIVTLDTFQYDHMGRLKNQVQCIGDDTLPDDCNSGATSANLTYNSVVSSTANHVAGNSITLNPGFHVIATSSLSFSAKIEAGGELIAENHYDDLGQLDQKKVGNKASTPLQTVDYKYNIRGWLKQINDPVTIGSKLFAFKIGYNEGSKPLFNGNIALTQWKTKSINPNPPNNPVSTQYTYTYDPLNRITGATGGANTNYDVSGISYDKNGNIMTLTRKGLSNPTSNTFGNMDILTYGYDNTNIGNKLIKVEDGSGSTEGFKNGSNTPVEYDYDANGNMTKDLNKGIGTTSVNGIIYNNLNLPTEVKFNNSNTQKINYIYSADGAKLQKIVNENGSVTTTDYAGNFIYENSSLKFFNQAEGYVEPVNPNNYSDGFNHIYQYKDHLGNIRLSYKNIGTTGTPNLEILEENNYYPFGLKHKGYNTNINGVDHPYGFGGKEEQNELGLGWIDITARNYNPELGRWMNLDPLAEQMRRHSPYNYAFNNPMRFIDPDGMAPFSTDVLKNEDGTYSVTNTGSATADDGDNNIYVVDENGERTGEIIGESLTSHSFYDDSGNAVDGAVIDVNSTEGQDFIDNEIIAADPNLAEYMSNATGGKKLDFKTNNIDNRAEGTTQTQYMYRGSATKDGKIASARDIGNMAAGIVAARNNLSWDVARLGFDALQTYQESDMNRVDYPLGINLSTEGIPTQKAQVVGFNIGSKLRVKRKSIRGQVRQDDLKRK